MIRFDRRTFLVGTSISLVIPGSSAISQTVDAIHVVKGKGCACCSVWANILKSEGFRVTEEEWLPADLVKLKLARGIPPQMAACHTAEILNYIIEGHVPPAEIRRLIAERPDSVGLSVPGMPYGSPGMGPESQREAYDVYLIHGNGESEIFSSYEAAS